MDRRRFLKNLALAAVATQVPKFLKETATTGVLDIEAGGFTSRTMFVYKEYALGFTISQEMLEDDMYGSLAEASKMLQKQAQLNNHHSLWMEEYNAQPD